MKKYFVLICCALGFFCRAEIGTWDNVSGNLKVKTDFWSCEFMEGQLFPAFFRFPDGNTPGTFLFRDSVTGNNHLQYSALDERWAETRILKNTKDELLLERSGSCWLNQSPVISRLPGVQLTCRWYFRKNSPDVRMDFHYRNTGKTSATLDRGIAIAWYFKHPFSNIEYNGKTIRFPHGQIYKPLTAKGKLILQGKDLRVTVAAPAITVESAKTPDAFILSVLQNRKLAAGNEECRISAVLTIEKNKNK